MIRLKEVTKPIFEVNFFGSVGLSEYIQKCYKLPNSFKISGASISMRLCLEINSTSICTDRYSLSIAERDLKVGYCDYLDLKILLSKMCIDGFLQPGIYLVNLSW